MTAYNHRVNHRHRVRRLRRTNRALYTLLFIVVVAVTGVSVYFWQQNNTPPTTVELKPQAAGAYYGAIKKRVTNELFQFDSTRDWQFSRESSDIPYKYVFYSQSNGIVEYELVVYLDRDSEKTGVSYIVPVTVQNGMLQPQKESPFCVETKKPKPTQLFAANFGGVSYTCDPHNSKQLYAAGVVGGSYKIPLYNSKGVLSQVIFNFTNHKSIAEADFFNEVLESFKLR